MTPKHADHLIGGGLSTFILYTLAQNRTGESPKLQLSAEGGYPRAAAGPQGNLNLILNQ